MKKFLKVMAVIAMTVAVAVAFCSCTENDTSKRLSNNFDKGIETKGIETKGIETKGIETKGIETKEIEVGTIEPKCVGTTYYWGSTTTYWDWSK